MNPTSGVFIRELASHVGVESDLEVMVQVPRFPPLRRYAVERRALKGVRPTSEDDPYKVSYFGTPYVPRWGLPESAVVGAAVSLASLSCLWATSRKAGVDLVHSHMGLNSFTGAAVALRHRVPLVTTVNGSDINVGTQVRPGNGFRRWATLRGLQASRMVIGISQDLCSKVAGLGIPEERVVHIPDGFDGAKFHPMDASGARRALGLPLDRKIVLSVSNLVPVKGLDLLIDAFAKSRSSSEGAHLYIVGDGPEYEPLSQAIGEQGVENKVHLVGRRDHSEVPLWMNACDLFAMASHSEGWPSVLPEVLACGRPVVATAVGGIPEIICEELLGELVSPGDAPGLMKAIDRNLRRSFDSEAISSYVQRFEWGCIVPRVLEVYRSVAA